ncbi:hypothetical protein NHQ30_006827 [Ciborinia camelliae]|nr:hypothetical protein NHQ30_006827 [Ciborinia camelliae]
MTDTNTLSLEQQRHQQIRMHVWLQQMQITAAQQQQQQQHAMEVNLNSNDSENSNTSFQPQSKTMATANDDLPLQAADTIFIDIGIPNSKPAIVDSYETACKNGSLSTVQSIITSEHHTPYFLSHGLKLVLQTGNVEITKYLLSAGAPITRVTATHILSAPSSQQIPLFELLFEHGWTPNIPGFYGQVLLPEIVTNIPLLRWFLSHGANTNLGSQRDNRDRFGGPEIDSCATLEAAAGRANLEAVRLILESGAKIENGYPLHSAAAACPPGTNPYVPPVNPSKEFDIGRIPVMDLLVSHGADVNQKKESRYMVPGYPIMYAVMAGAVERVNWLLEHGANPELKGSYGSAVDYVEAMGSENMKRVLEEGMKARKWFKDHDPKATNSTQ